MAFITSELLFRIPVETTDGRQLGRVVGLEIDIESQNVLRYQVRHKGLVAEMLNRHDMLIGRGQIIAITKDKIIVESGMIEESDASVGTRFARVGASTPMSSHLNLDK